MLCLHGGFRGHHRPGDEIPGEGFPLGLPIVAFGVHTPEMIARPITMVGNITVPAALMIIGINRWKIQKRRNSKC